MVRQLSIPRYEWPLGKITRIFPDESNVVQTVGVEVGQKSIHSATYIVPLELGCEGEDAVPAVGDEIVEEGEELLEQSSLQAATENGNIGENETAGQSQQ